MTPRTVPPEQKKMGEYPYAHYTDVAPNNRFAEFVPLENPCEKRPFLVVSRDLAGYALLRRYGTSPRPV